MRRLLIWSSSIVIAACGGGSGAGGDLTDVTGAKGTREVVGAAFGQPLPQATADEKAEFQAGLSEFIHNRDPATGLGPVMTSISCSSCHDSPPAIGGTNQRIETRFGKRNADGSYDDLISLGGPLLQDEGIGNVNGVNWVAEKLPPQANVVSGRRTTPVFGLGLVDATPDATFQGVAAWQRANHPEVAGRPAIVRDLTRKVDAVGRFGWKANEPTLLQFTADALINEMGVTTPIFPDENCPQGNCALLASNPAPGINDPDGVGMTKAAGFMTFLGPPTAPKPGSAGQKVFTDIGCAVCHQQTLVSGKNASAALDRVAYHPFSDFLLHDMGSLGDGIDQGDAKGNEMRTAPLWGLHFQSRLLHDGRAHNIPDAIVAHDGQGKSAADKFAALSDGDRGALLSFLQSL